MNRVIMNKLKPFDYSLLFKTKYFKCIFSFCIVVLFTQGCRLPQTKLPKSVMNNSRITEDLDFFRRISEEIIPYPYLFSDKFLIDSLSNEIKHEKELSGIAFLERMEVLIAAYNVPHMSVSYPTMLKNEKHKPGIFPLSIRRINNSIEVDKLLFNSISVPVGSKLLNINGLNADSLFLDYTKYTGGLKAWKQIRTERDFYYHLWKNGIRSQFKVEYVDSLNQSHSVILKGYGTEERKRNKKQEKNKQKLQKIDTHNSSSIESFGNYIDYARFNDSIAYIQFKSMSIYLGLSEYQNFLKKTFTHIKENPTSKLIIDMRGNGGGNSDAGQALVNYFANKPYKMSGGKYWKISKAYKKNFYNMIPFMVRPVIGFFEPFKSAFKTFRGVSQDSIIKYHGDFIPVTDNNELKFTGKVFLIIDNGTFSSATMTSNAIEDYNLATIVGNTSGEVVNDLGENVAVRLPNSGILCWLPSALFLRANGDANNNNPVLPDVFIDQHKLSNMSRKEIVEFILNIE
jgi:hypothetical protein